MTKTGISVVIPAFNAAATLPECLDSVLAQSRKDIEVVVVNDGSTDDTVMVAEKYSYEDGRVRCINRKNEGVSAARNFGAEAASGELLFFLDADDLLPENALEARSRAIETCPGGIVLTQIRRFRMEGRNRLLLDLSDPPPYWKKNAYLLTLLTLDLRRMVLFKPFLRRNDFLASGGYDTGLRTCEDWELWFRLACRHRIVNLREPLYLYRKHHASLTMRYDTARALSDHFSAIDKIASEGRIAEKHVRDAKTNRVLEFAGNSLYEGDRKAAFRFISRHAFTLPLYRNMEFYKILLRCNPFLEKT